MARAQSRAFGSTERDFDWQQRHRTTHVDDRRRDVESRELAEARERHDAISKFRSRAKVQIYRQRPTWRKLKIGSTRIFQRREKRGKDRETFLRGDQANLWSTCERQKLIWGMRKRKEKNRTKLRHEWSGRSRGTYLRTGGALDLWMPAQVPISIVSSFVSFHRYSYTVCRLK